MRKRIIPGAVALLTLGLASSAQASLIFVTDIEIGGTGLGAVNTLVTVHDSGGGNPNANGIEGGCVNQNGSTGAPCDAVGTEITESDTTALNNTFVFDTTQSFAAVVNIAETGADPEPQTTLTGLYLYFCSTTQPAQCHLAQWFEADKLLAPASGEGTGVGGSGFVFRLTDAEFTLVQGLPGDFVRVSGGVQFAGGTTNNGPETLHVIRIEGDDVVAPEPASLVLFGLALTAVGFARRRRLNS